MKENTKNTLRKIGMKLLLLIAVLAVLDVLYFFTFYPKDLEEHCSLMELSQKPVPEGDDIVYLGESSNHAYSEADTDRRPISMMLDLLFRAPILHCFDPPVMIRTLVNAGSKPDDKISVISAVAEPNWLSRLLPHI